MKTWLYQRMVIFFFNRSNYTFMILKSSLCIRCGSKEAGPNAQSSWDYLQARECMSSKSRKICDLEERMAMPLAPAFGLYTFCHLSLNSVLSAFEQP